MGAPPCSALALGSNAGLNSGLGLALDVRSGFSPAVASASALAGRRGVAGTDAIADEMVNAILADFDRPGTGDVLLFVNGFGGTPAIELYLMYNAARKIIGKRGLKVARSLVGSYVTSLEMAGCSITITLLDQKLTALWDDPIHTAALRW